MPTPTNTTKGSKRATGWPMRRRPRRIAWRDNPRHALAERLCAEPELTDIREAWDTLRNRQHRQLRPRPVREEHRAVVFSCIDNVYGGQCRCHSWRSKVAAAAS
jgi:hypothetical protein